MKNILVVEDDEFFTIALRGLLEAEGFHVHSAENGKVAIDHIEKHAIDCVVSDLQMPVMGGIDLAKWVSQNRKLPFIMMTGYIESMNTLTAVELGAVNILYKPFTDEDVVKAVRDAMAQSRAAADNAEIPGFARIPQSALVASSIAEYNLYRRLDGRLQKIVSKGEPFYLKDLVYQKGKYVYTETENIETIVRANLMVVKAVSKSSSVNPIKKTDMIQSSLELLEKHVAHAGPTAAAQLECTELVTSFLNVIERSHVWEILNRFHGNSDSPQAVTVISSTVAVLIAEALGHNEEVRLKTAAAGFFPGVPFDFGSDREEKELIARTKNVAARFCNLIQKSPGSPGLRPAQAIAVLEKDARYDSKPVGALKELISADSPKGKQSA